MMIIYDDYHAGKTIGEYIGKKGHQKVGYIGVYETDQAVGIERRNGVLDGLKEYGITPVTGKSDYSFIGGQTVTRELLESGELRELNSHGSGPGARGYRLMLSKFKKYNDDRMKREIKDFCLEEFEDIVNPY